MPLYDRKIDKFINTIILDAKSECKKIRVEIDKRRNAFLEKAENELLNEMYGYIRTKAAEARANAGRRISQKSLENKKALRNCRSKIEKMVLDKVREQILEYVKTPEYISKLRNMAAYASEILREKDIVINLRPEDMKYAEELNSVTPATYAEGDFTLGGLIAASPSKNLRIDMSFDTSLIEVSKDFGRISGLGT